MWFLDWGIIATPGSGFEPERPERDSDSRGHRICPLCHPGSYNLRLSFQNKKIKFTVIPESKKQDRRFSKSLFETHQISSRNCLNREIGSIILLAAYECHAVINSLCNIEEYAKVRIEPLIDWFLVHRNVDNISRKGDRPNEYR